MVKNTEWITGTYCIPKKYVIDYVPGDHYAYDKNVPTCGENAYRSDYTQGVGLITLHEKHPRDYDYELIQMYRLALDKDSKIPEADGHPKSYYQQIAFLDAVPQLFF